MVTKRRHDWPVGINGFVGILSCLLGLGVTYLGYGLGTKSPKVNAGEPLPAASSDRKRPVRAMNMALGDMVYFAQDLGFRVANAKNESVEATKLAGRVESQLQSIRELYRLEIAKNSTLAGTLTLKLSVDSTGHVNRVQEISSRLPDDEFKTAVVASMTQWSFAGLVSENLVVTCPLLFVHQGMDITTLVNWEKFLGRTADQGELTQSAHTAAQHSTVPRIKSVRPAAKPSGRKYRTKYATSLRGQPNFSAASLATIAAGARIIVIGTYGDWLKVRSADTGATGFLRKEFVAPVHDVAQK
ncbi:MAG TPA: AgmX/PglI C-terminal domain-containing protein [Terriglobales bacterium]|nr:AgmX/PglI C-terminal domain-containing protein [Terriglobales bacterium]